MNEPTPVEVFRKDLFDLGISEVDAMNLLQGEAGVISDHCVWADDIAHVDLPRAIEWLRNHRK